MILLLQKGADFSQLAYMVADSELKDRDDKEHIKLSEGSDAPKELHKVNLKYNALYWWPIKKEKELEWKPEVMPIFQVRALTHLNIPYTGKIFPTI